MHLNNISVFASKHGENLAHKNACTMNSMNIEARDDGENAAAPPSLEFTKPSVFKRWALWPLRDDPLQRYRDARPSAALPCDAVWRIQEDRSRNVCSNLGSVLTQWPPPPPQGFPPWTLAHRMSRYISLSSWYARQQNHSQFPGYWYEMKIHWSPGTRNGY